MLKALLASVALVLTLGSAVNSLAADGAPAKRQVVLQVNEDNEKTWNHALTLAKNMQKNSGGKDGIDIEIVAMSPGIKMVADDSTVANRVTEAAENGIMIRACGNTMKAIHWDKDRLAEGVVVVPFGALEIIDKQQQGWAYIKP